MSEEKSVLRWAGLAGMAGVLIIVLSLVNTIVAPAFVASSTCGPACAVDASIASFPSEKTAFTIGLALYSSGLMLFVFLFLGLYRALRGGDSLAPALFGCGIGVLGLLLLLTGGLPSVAFAHLSDVYHAAGTTPQDQATLVLVSHGVQAIFNETDTVGGILLTAGFILFGIAMFRNPAFGKILGSVTLALCIVVLGGLSLISIAQDNPNDYAFVILVVALPLMLGWKLFRLSRPHRFSPIEQEKVNDR